MKKEFPEVYLVGISFILLSLISCNGINNTPSKQALIAMNLKRGDIVMCGPADQSFGALDFETSCPEIVCENFALAIAMLHSFEYDEAEKIFSKIIDAAPDCAMAYWGVAAEASHHPEKAKYYYRQLISMANPSGAKRPEIEKAMMYSGKENQ